jgi:thiol-disulfide isomerase/thioredoxin
MKASLRSSCAVAAALHAVLASATFAQARPKPVPVTFPLPSAASVATAADAVALVRRLYFIGEQNDGVALGDSLMRRFPRDTRLRAWTVANAWTSGRAQLAESLTVRIDTASRDPWNLAARAFARRSAGGSSRAASVEALHLAQRARLLAPRDPDLAWLVASTLLSIGSITSPNAAAVVAFVDSVAPRIGNAVDLQVARAGALYTLATPFTPGAPNSSPDTAKRNDALRLYAAARAADPTNYEARMGGAARLRSTDEAASLAVMKEAIALAPRAPNPRVWHWQLIQSQRGPTVAEKNAAVNADFADFLTRTDSAPWALETVISTKHYLTKEPFAALEDRILAKAPRSSWAETVLLNRANQWRDSLLAARDSTRPGPKSDSTIVRARYIAEMEAFIGKPWIANPATRDQAIVSLFFEVREDSTYPADRLVALVKQVVDSKSALHPSVRYGQTARSLASRKLEFPYAEQLAREGAKHVARYIGDFPGFYFTSVGDQANTVDAGQAEIYDALGFALFNGGRYDDADKALTHALELTKKNAGIYYDLGRLRAAQGREDEAELVYAEGMTVRYRGVNPNKKELARLYEKKHGSAEGWDKYIATLEEKERTSRRDRILGKRISPPLIAPAFRLADLAGNVVNSDSLRSQTIVVNFWGMWCGPCVAEMPELQQFYDKYRNDKSVTILTISNDKDLGELREWMAKRKLTVPTLFDDGYVGKTALMNTFPTTWFIDRDGKTQFSVSGNAGNLVEEWSWRLEATKAGVGLQP